MEYPIGNVIADELTDSPEPVAAFMDGLASTGRARRVAAEGAVGTFVPAHDAGTTASLASVAGPRQATGGPARSRVMLGDR
jgi:hypothetical protein